SGRDLSSGSAQEGRPIHDVPLADHYLYRACVADVLQRVRLEDQEG
ncbi:MAG: hypothetical protein ACI9K5_004177, partial [Gammaproteobacteria bacterium]